MPEPHRSLSLGSRGEDVRQLQAATDRRLEARGQDEYKVGAHDGDFGRNTARGVSRAAYLLGALDVTWEAARVDHGGHVSIGLQRMIRNPGRRTPEQLGRARNRLEHVRADAPSPGAHGISLATRAARLALAHAPEVHYTQDRPDEVRRQGGLRRWEGINGHMLASRGRFPRYADCSSFYTWCLWQLLGDGPDVVNGSGWRGGYTGTLLAHGRRADVDVEGAAVLYGVRGSTGKHVAYSLGNGQVISHGSEGGPYLLPYNYRSDVMAVRAYH